jgi:hypothetical protein
MATVVAILSDRFNRKTSGWVGDLTKTITWLCPLRTFIVFASRTVAYRLIALANIDRWLSSCLYRLITDLIYAFVVNIFPLIIIYLQTKFQVRILSLDFGFSSTHTYNIKSNDLQQLDMFSLKHRD